MVLVFTPGFLYRQLGNDMRTAGWEEAGRGGCGPHLEAYGPIVLVYCLSVVIFIQLWGQMQSDAMALLWKRGLTSTQRNKGPPVEWALQGPYRLLFVSIPHTIRDENQAGSSRKEPAN